MFGHLAHINALDFLDLFLEVIHFGQNPMTNHLHIVNILDIKLFDFLHLLSQNAMDLVFSAAVNFHDGFFDEFVKLVPFAFEFFLVVLEVVGLAGGVGEGSLSPVIVFFRLHCLFPDSLVV